ncbi:MAG: N-glycosylase/DNA lyase [Candidatus Thermoplasmatota archaeon]
MDNLVSKIEKLKKTDIKNKIDQRIKEFQSISQKSKNQIFEELCFCILTANFNAEKTIQIQNKIGESFLQDSEKKLATKLKKCGHRFPNKRAQYICESKKQKNELYNIVENEKEEKIREWLVNNIKGIGYKESSHFLRNIGFQNIAIIDFHIVDLLFRYNLIKKPKTITKKRYLEIEEILKKIADRADVTLAELDLYLWYMETGKILK